MTLGQTFLRQAVTSSFVFKMNKKLGERNNHHCGPVAQLVSVLSGYTDAVDFTPQSGHIQESTNDV